MDFVLRWLEPRARRAKAKQELRATIKRNPIARAQAMGKSEKRKALDEADAAFSQYIRHRDCSPGTDGIWRGACVTCGKGHTLAELQCGHWQKRGNFGVRFYERNAHAQCGWCNDPRRGNGRMPEHEKAIALKYGADAPDAIRAYMKIHKKKPRLLELRAHALHFTQRAELQKAVHSTPKPKGSQ